jgi:hypothetical protein
MPSEFLFEQLRVITLSARPRHSRAIAAQVAQSWLFRYFFYIFSLIGKIAKTVQLRHVRHSAPVELTARLSGAPLPRAASA